MEPYRARYVVAKESALRKGPAPAGHRSGLGRELFNTPQPMAATVRCVTRRTSLVVASTVLRTGASAVRSAPRRQTQTAKWRCEKSDLSRIADLPNWRQFGRSGSIQPGSRMPPPNKGERKHTPSSQTAPSEFAGQLPTHRNYVPLSSSMSARRRGPLPIRAARD